MAVGLGAAAARGQRGAAVFLRRLLRRGRGRGRGEALFARRGRGLLVRRGCRGLPCGSCPAGPAAGQSRVLRAVSRRVCETSVDRHCPAALGHPPPATVL